MSEERKYNTDALFVFPLITAGDVDFVASVTPAAGDCKLWSDTQIFANTTAKILGFDSMSERPSVGDQINENGAGTAQAIVMAVVIISGTVGGGDAAGFMFVRSVSGQVWSNDDQIDINGGTADVATADSTTYDLAATAGLFGLIGNGAYVIALTPTEMSCVQGELHFIDSATKAWEDQAIRFTTYGNASAMHAMDFDDAVRGGMTALPDAAADGPGGLVVSDAGGLDLDAKLANTNEVTAARMGALTDWIDDGRLDALLDAIKAKTDNLPTDPADQSLIIAATDAILALLPGALVNGRMDASVDGTGMESGAVDAIWAKTMAELAAVPGATATVLAALIWVFTLARNEGDQTSTKKTIYKNDKITPLANSVISSDGTTFKRGEFTDGA